MSTILERCALYAHNSGKNYLQRRVGIYWPLARSAEMILSVVGENELGLCAYTQQCEPRSSNIVAVLRKLQCVFLGTSKTLTTERH